MSILWLIIKVILFMLLGIVVFLVTGVAIILLAPIRYEVYAEKYDELIYDIHFRYLRGIKGSFYLEDGIKNHKVSMFGKIFYEEKVKEHKVEDDKVMEQSSQSNGYIKELVQQDRNGPKYRKQAKKEILSKKIIEPSITKEIKHTTQEAAEQVKEQTKREIKEIPRLGSKEILLNPLTYRAIKCLVRAIWDILKIIAPKEWDFEVVLGTGDPGDTGELIAKLILLYPIYYPHGIIRGDYEKKCLMGGCLIKGKFRLGQIAIRLIQLYLQRDVRAFMHLILK